MKKMIFTLLIVLTMFMNVSDVSAKNLEKTCNYKVTNGNETTTVVCSFYDNNSHSCKISNNKAKNNKESLKNWDRPHLDTVFVAKNYYSETKSCMPYVIFVDDGGNVLAYTLYAADSYNTVTLLQNKFDLEKNKVVIVPQTGTEIKADEIIASYTEMLKDVGDSFGLDSVCDYKDGKYVLNFNKGYENYEFCFNVMKKMNDKINEWDEYVKKQIADGNITADNQAVKDYYAARDAAKNSFSDKYDTGEKENVDDETDWSGQNQTSGKTVAFFKKIYTMIKIIIPVLIVVLSIIDFLKVLLTSDEKNYKEAWNKFIKRIIVGVIFFILPSLVSFLINLSGIATDENIFSIFT